MAGIETTDLDERFAASRAVRRRFEPQWFLNIAFYEGNQWVGFDGGKLFEVQLEDWRAKIVDNRILPAVRTEIAKMTKTRPVWVGVPKDSSDEQIQSAKLRERVFEHYWGALHASPRLRSALLWSRVTGAGFWKVTWDRSLGDGVDVFKRPDGTIARDVNGGPITPARADAQDPEYMATLKQDRITMGDVRLEVRTPFEIFPDPLAGDDGLPSAEWIGEEAVYSKQYLERAYGQKASQLKTDAKPTSGISASRGLGIGSGSTDDKTGGVKVREFWSKPTAEFPNGKHVIYAQDTILLEEDNPYRDLPYFMFRSIPAAGRFWPTCVVEQAIPQQTALNKVESQIAENAERIGNPPLIRSSAAADEDTEWHGLPGEEIVFQDLGTPGSVPQFLSVPELPGYVQTQIQRIEQSLREIFRQNEASTGTVPTGVTAASAINLLQEANDTVLGPDIEDMELAVQGAGRQVMRLLKAYCDERRIVRIAGDDGAWDMFPFTGQMLGDGTLDEVQAGSGLPQSKAAKQAAIQSVLTLMIQNGQAPAPRDLRRVLRDFEVGGLEHFFAGLSRDEQQITSEHRRLLTGQPLAINSYDDDEAHIAGHQEFQKSDRYQHLAATPQGQLVQQAIEMHVKEHQARLAERASSMAGAAQPDAAGGPLAGLEGAAAAPAGGLPPEAALPSA